MATDSRMTLASFDTNLSCSGQPNAVAITLYVTSGLNLWFITLIIGQGDDHHTHPGRDHHKDSFSFVHITDNTPMYIEYDWYWYEPSQLMNYSIINKHFDHFVLQSCNHKTEYKLWDIRMYSFQFRKYKYYSKKRNYNQKMVTYSSKT